MNSRSSVAGPVRDGCSLFLLFVSPHLKQPECDIQHASSWSLQVLSIFFLGVYFRPWRSEIYTVVRSCVSGAEGPGALDSSPYTVEALLDGESCWVAKVSQNHTELVLLLSFCLLLISTNQPES